MKLPFTENKRKVWLKACRELLKQYQNGTHHQNVADCPLCQVLRRQCGCTKCPWVQFTGVECETYYFIVVPANKQINMDDPIWIQFRIPQLMRWIQWLEGGEVKV